MRVLGKTLFQDVTLGIVQSGQYAGTQCGVLEVGLI